MRLLLIMATLFSSMAEAKDLELSTRAHIERVKSMGQILLREFPEEFPDIDSEHVRYYLQLHDLPKIMDMVSLKEWDYSLRYTILQGLTKYFGVNRRDTSRLTFEQISELDAIIGELNRIEKEMKLTLLSHMTSEQREQLEHLERIVDLVDTGLTRHRELGVNKDEALASRWASMDESSMRMIEWLEMRLMPQAMCRNVLEEVR